MHTGDRSKWICSAALAWQLAAVGCSGQKAEAQRALSTATRSYAQLGPRLAELQGRLSALHADVEALAAALPAGRELRARYFTTEEVLGVIDGKLKWLSGEIEAARKSPRMDRAIAIKDALSATGHELAEVSKAAVEIVHESGRLQRIAALVKTPERFGAFKKVLATGFEIEGADDGAEAGLVESIEALGRTADRARWLDLDRVFFVGSAELDVRSSRVQLDNLSQILKANPSVKLHIAADADRQSPSQERARAVVRALVQMGVAPARLRAMSTPLPMVGPAGHDGRVGVRVVAR